jgi:response regulator RpfG family c-di-GMP phosphodiesterase
MDLLAKKLNILIVEDDDEEYNLLLDCIQNSCILTEHILHAKNITQTKEYLLGEIRFDLVFMDLKIQNHQQADFLFQIMDWADHKLPIVALCEVASPETTLLALINGAKHYLIKGDYDELAVEKVIKDCFSIVDSSGGYFENREFLGDGIALGAVWDIDLIQHQVKRSGKQFYESLGTGTMNIIKSLIFGKQDYIQTTIKEL